jgi:hypothetical protein
MTTFATPRLDAIAPSLTSPRKTFDPARLDELTASIKASAEVVHRILTDPRPAAHLAAEMGISRSLVQKIRAGKARKQVSASLNPFAGLMR